MRTIKLLMVLIILYVSSMVIADVDVVKINTAVRIIDSDITPGDGENYADKAINESYHNLKFYEYTSGQPVINKLSIGPTIIPTYTPIVLESDLNSENRQNTLLGYKYHIDGRFDTTEYLLLVITILLAIITVLLGIVIVRNLKLK